jgi:hypothetical protein
MIFGDCKIDYWQLGALRGSGARLNSKITNFSHKRNNFSLHFSQISRICFFFFFFGLFFFFFFCFFWS